MASALVNSVCVCVCVSKGGIEESFRLFWGSDGGEGG